MTRCKRGVRAVRSGLVRGFGAAVVVAAAPVAVADEYSWEVSARNERLDIGDVIDGDALSAAATYYFAPIDDSRGPYSLAAFLSRASRVGIEAHKNESTTTITVSSPFTGTTTSTSESETQGAVVFGRYVWPRSGWFAGGSYDAGDADPPSSPLTQHEIDIEGYTLHFGKYVGPTTALELGWRSSETRDEVTVLRCFGSPLCAPVAGAELTAEEASVRIFHVGSVGRLTYSLSGVAGARRGEVDILPAVVLDPTPPPTSSPVPPPFGPLPNPGTVVQVPSEAIIGDIRLSSVERARTFALAATFFPTAALGVGVGYSVADGDRNDEDGYSVSVDWHFLRNVAVGVSIARTSREGPIGDMEDLDHASLRISARF